MMISPIARAIAYSVVVLLPFRGLTQVVGPMVGHVTPTEARLLYRPGSTEIPLLLTAYNAATQPVATALSSSTSNSDFVAQFHLTGLAPDELYAYRIDSIVSGVTQLVAGGTTLSRFRTPQEPGQRGVYNAAFTSCANTSTLPVWKQMMRERIDGLFLIGDTPYIDTSVLTTIRQKHRDFLRTPGLTDLMARIPTMGVWDDHDFGLNDGNGLNFMAGKAATRQGFVEYRAHAQYGTGTEGVYHQFASGPIEIFLLDPRWFSQTGPSPVDPAQTTCFGTSQWSWIRSALKASKAPFKVLAQGMTWQDKKNTEIDDMFTYWYERDALYDFIRDERIAGVVLIGGDIHVSRHLIHPNRVGYDLHDFVTSPAHSSVIPSLDVFHPDLVWSAKLGLQFLTLTADTRVNPPTLTAQFRQGTNAALRTVRLTLDDLTPREGAGLARDLCAYWPFDEDGSNRAASGSRLQASPSNGAMLASAVGIRGNAAQFTRAATQYAYVASSPLPDNCARLTASLWMNTTNLPAHGSVDRAFLLETAPHGVTTNSNDGYSLSLGLRSTTNDALVNLQWYTRTLTIAPPDTAPGVIVQSGDTLLDRALFSNGWTHLAYTFEPGLIRLFVNASNVATHSITSGPIAEIAGLVIAGHRTGSGRNFDGQIDELALWSRVLSDQEIVSLFNDWDPPVIPTALSVVDSDGDSLPDWWETLCGLDPLNPDDATSDPDGDGLAAMMEYSTGLSPLERDDTYLDTLLPIGGSGLTRQPLLYTHPTTARISMELAPSESTNPSQWTASSTGTVWNSRIQTNRISFSRADPASALSFQRLGVQYPGE